jgi:hypothetical protein
MVHRHPNPDLMQIIHAVCPFGAFLRRRQGWQQHGGKNRDDGNYHEQFNECECLETGPVGGVSFHAIVSNVFNRTGLPTRGGLIRFPEIEGGRDKSKPFASISQPGDIRY